MERYYWRHCTRSGLGAVKRIRIRATRKRRAFVLISVVILLAITSLLLTQLAIVSLGEARRVVADQRELRERWAVTSLRRFVAERGESLIQRGKSSSQFEIHLADVHWRMTVADESAKLHLPSLIAERPVADVRQAIARLLPGRLDASLTRRPDLISDSEQQQIPSRFEAWFNVRGDSSNRDTYHELSQQLTLWGNGRLNLTRASDATVNAVWSLLLGRPAPTEVLSIGGDPTRDNWQDVRLGLNFREKDLATIDRFCGVSSSAVSVWLVPQERSASDQAYFFVFNLGTTSGNQHVGFIY